MDKINTKSKIKSIALNLFNRMGTLSVSLNSIAKEVGISPGNLRYHYKTREEIILDLYYDMQTKIESLNSFEAILTADNPLKIMAVVFDKYGEIFWFYRFIMRDAFVLITLDPALREILVINRENKMKQIAGFLKFLASEGIIQNIHNDEIELRIKLHWFIPAYWQIFASTFGDITKNSIQESKEIIFKFLLFPYLTEKGLELYKQI